MLVSESVSVFEFVFEGGQRLAAWRLACTESVGRLRRFVTCACP